MSGGPYYRISELPHGLIFSLIDVCLNVLTNLLLLSVYLIINLKVNTNLHFH